MDAFLNEVDALRDSVNGLDDTITRIGQLSITSSNSASPDSATEELARLQGVVRTSVRDTAARLQALRAPPGQRQHVTALHARLQLVLARFQRVQAEHRQRTVQRVRRQIRIGAHTIISPTGSRVTHDDLVSPNATNDEITRVLDAGVQDGQIFQQAARISSHSTDIELTSHLAPRFVPQPSTRCEPRGSEQAR
jgi:t-SNARE complex subunit (syntaxin)